MNLSDLKALLEKATPGPWYVGSDGLQDAYMPIHAPSWGGFIDVCIPDNEEMKEFVAEGNANAALICALRNAAPALIAAAEREERLRKALIDCFGAYPDEVADICRTALALEGTK